MIRKVHRWYFFTDKANSQEHKFAKLKEISDGETPLHLQLNKSKKRLRKERVGETTDCCGNTAQWPKWFLRTELFKISVEWFVF